MIGSTKLKATTLCRHGGDSPLIPCAVQAW